MNLHRKSTSLGKKLQEQTTVLDARHIKTNEAEFKKTCMSMTSRVFAGRSHIEMKDILALRNKLRIAFLHTEFMFYVEEIFDLPDEPEEEGKEPEMPKKPEGEQVITMKAFAKSLLNFMPFKKYKQYADRIDKMDHLNDKNVTFDQYVAFHSFLEEIDALKEHVQAYRYVDKQVFKDFVHSFVKDNHASGKLKKK